jgi:hypothetical protein
MSQAQAELCQLRLEETRQRVDSLTRMTFFQRYVAYRGTDIIAKSDEFIRDFKHWVSAQEKNRQTQLSNQAQETAYQQILRKLMTEGWEPLGTDEDGRVMSFKRTVSSNDSSSNFVVELEKLSKLKNEGLLTEDEFNAAKRKLIG